MRYWCFTEQQARAAAEAWAEARMQAVDERDYAVDLIMEFLLSDAARRHKLVKTDQEGR